MKLERYILKKKTGMGAKEGENLYDGFILQDFLKLSFPYNCYFFVSCSF